MNIAVDFDGTIVEHRYPDIGKERLLAIKTLLELQKQAVKDTKTVGNTIQQPPNWRATITRQ